MSNVIGFLERMGQDAQWRYASSSDVEQALDAAQVDPQLRVAILTKDKQRIEALFGGGKIYCALMPGKQDEDEGEGDDGEETPSRQEPEISLRRMHHVVG